uniref:Pentatricopeptide repeat-containing protein n=1 Tax=Cucumis melo TaxID=3656 RepID=A0A9I9CIM8_CUCME
MNVIIRLSSASRIFPVKIDRNYIFSTTHLSFCTYNSTCTAPTSNDFDPLIISDLISRQRWSILKSHVKFKSPIDFLHQLMCSGAVDPLLVLRYFNWSRRELKVNYSIELICRLLHLLANVKYYPKIRSVLDSFVKGETNCSISLIFHSLSVCSDQFCANSIIADMLVLAYVQNSKTVLGLEAFKRAGDYRYKLSVLSCNPLLSALVKESEFGDVEFVYKEMIRRKISPNLITFNIVINGLCKGKLEDANGLLNEMLEKGLIPNRTTYEIIKVEMMEKGFLPDIEGHLYHASH